MLGNGDGTFQPPINYTGYNTYIMSLITGDFNGDGKLDVVELAWEEVGTLKGNGDGSLQSPVTSLISGPISGYTAIAGDFNYDGKLDLAYGGNPCCGITFISGNYRPNR